MAMTPAEFPRNGPLLVILFSTPLSLILGGAEGGTLFNPSINPQVPPTIKADRYVVPVP